MAQFPSFPCPLYSGGGITLFLSSDVLLKKTPSELSLLLNYLLGGCNGATAGSRGDATWMSRESVGSPLLQPVFNVGHYELVFDLDQEIGHHSVGRWKKTEN